MLGGPLWRARSGLPLLVGHPGAAEPSFKRKGEPVVAPSRRQLAPPPLPLSGSRGGGENLVLYCNDLRDRDCPVSALGLSG